MSFEALKERWLKQIMADKELPCSAFPLCFVISTYMNRKKGGEAYPSLETLAKDTGMSRRWVIVLTKRLEERGHLEIKHNNKGRKNVSNRYRPRLHQGSELAASPEPLNEPLSEPLNKPKTENFRKNACSGRSTGCITLDPVENNELITLLQDGALVYVTVGDAPIEQYL